MKYLLKNKDKVILEFEVKEIQSKFELYGDDTQRFITRKVISNVEILDSTLIPKSINVNNIDKSLTNFIKHRKVPSNRAFVNDILKTLNAVDSDDNFMAYVDISLALSLNDSFWIVPSDKDYKWKDYNLYDNKFDEALSLVAFSGGSHKISGITSSPEYTTNGMLKKCWHRDDGQIYLYKGSTENSYNSNGIEAYSEYYMAQIAEMMGFDFVPYDLREFHGQIVSVCPIFTNENEGYIPIHHLLSNDFDKDNSEKLALEISKIYGKSAFEDLMLFDALICNTDRHLGNFGMIIDNNTNEILRPAPIFDNGNSIIENVGYDESQHAKTISSQFISKPLRYNFNKQLELFVRHRHLDGLNRLVRFNFKRHEKFNLDDNFLESIQKCIKYRANLALEFAYTNNNDNITHKPRKP